ncbi:hypothetical protein C3737_12735 [Aeromonas jandaei]|jgi:hypothetical protein|uniref:HI1506-related protein n=1 Tax=Aeromonas jandaei TaxID=650 RepID=UPI000CE1B901|nr:HI1506-related protein [Aeromonas jandaei]PPA30462.1 hypothetical protein C3737_12735 [Aeromonas jandaei]
MEQTQDMVIDITAKREGFRRAGIAHSETTKTYPVSRFTPAQLEQLKAEPMLIVAVRRNGDEPAQPSELAVLNAKVLELEADIGILTKQQTEALAQVETLTGELATERETTVRLQIELEAERQTVSDLTAQLEAAKAPEQGAKDATDKKGK